MKKLFFVLASAALSLVGCSKSSGGIDDDSQSGVPTITLDDEASRSLTFAAEGGEQTVLFAVSANWTASVTTDDGKSWCTLTPASGYSGRVSLKVAALATTLNEARATTIEIRSGATVLTISVTQSGLEPDSIEFPDDGSGDGSARTLHFTAEGGAEAVTFTASGGWTASVAAEAQDWCGVEPASGEGGEQQTTVTVQPNEAKEERTTIVTLVCGAASVTITVTQDGTDWFDFGDGDGSGDGSSARTLHFTAEGGSEAVSFTVSGDWTASVATEAQDWCSVTPASGEGGEQQITVTVQPNEAKEERTTTVTLVCGSASVTIAVTQDGTDWFDFGDGDGGGSGDGSSARMLHFTAEGGSEAVSFTVSGDWTASVAAEARDWCSVEPASGEGGEQQITVTVQPNETKEERMTTVTLVCGAASVTITVTQDGADWFDFGDGDGSGDGSSARTLHFTAEGGSEAVSFTVSGDWTAEVAAGQSWCTVAPTKGAAGKQQITVTARPNEAKEERTTTVTLVCGKATVTIAVTQDSADWFDFGDGSGSGDGNSARTLHFTAEGGSEAVSLTVSGDWTAAVDAAGQSWCSVTPVGGTGGKSTITVTALATDSTAERAATVTLRCGKAAVTIAVTQEGRTNSDETIPNNEIHYTTTDGNVVDLKLSGENRFGEALVISNTYENGIGKIVFDRELTQISGSAVFERSKLTSIILPNSLTEIGHSTFRTCEYLVDVKLPKNLKTIGPWAFMSNRALTDIEIPDSVTDIGDSAFETCTSLKNVKLSKNLTVLNNWLFRYCTSLTEISLPESITTINSSVFEECHSLTTIKLPDNLTEIRTDAFYWCKSLTDIEIPANVNRISSAFRYCSNLKRVYCKPTTPPTFGLYGDTTVPFYGTSNALTIYVPRGSVQAYKTDADWSRYADRIVGYDFE